MKGFSHLPYTTTTLYSPRQSPSSATMSSSARCLPASPYHVYPYRSPRPSTLPCPLPAPPCLSCWWIEDSTGSWRLSPGITSPTFSERFSSPSLRSNARLTTAVTRWRRRFHSNQRVGYPNLDLPIPTPLDPQDIHPPPSLYCRPTPPSIQLPNWPDEPTPSLIVSGPRLPFPQENDIVAMLCRLNEAGEGLADEVLLEWALDVLCSPEDWRWLWSLGPATTPLISPTPLNHPPPLLYNASNASPWTMYTPTAPNMSVRSVDKLPPDTLSAHAPCAPAPSAENSVTWVPLAQPQPQHAYHLSLPEWVTWDDLELESQGYDGGNVIVIETPTPFSPFPLTDCMLYSHFSFDDFIRIAFPNLTRDLDDQI